MINKESNKLGILSLLLGIISILLGIILPVSIIFKIFPDIGESGVFPFSSFVGAITGIILAIIQRKNFSNIIATTGLILSIIALSINIILILMFLYASSMVMW